jgi:hypothetical protein
MDEHDKLDLIAAILAAGSGERSQDVVANFRAIGNSWKLRESMTQRCGDPSLWKRQSHPRTSIRARVDDHRRFAEALSRLVGEAEDAGPDPQEILAEIEGTAEAMRLCVEEWAVGDCDQY